MAMIDYGSIVKKNGQIVQKEMFMGMEESVGFAIDKKLEFRYIANDFETNKPKEWIESIKLNGNFFSYMGDKELLVCVYKTKLVIISNCEKVEKIFWYGTNSGYEFEDGLSVKWIRFVKNFEINGVKFQIKRMYGKNRFKLRFWYKNDLYECLYGYGVDVRKNKWSHVSLGEQGYLDKWFKNGLKFIK